MSNSEKFNPYTFQFGFDKSCRDELTVPGYVELDESDLAERSQAAEQAQHQEYASPENMAGSLSVERAVAS